MNVLMNKKSYINPETSIETRVKIECRICEVSNPDTTTSTEYGDPDDPDNPGGPGFGGETAKGRGANSDFGNIW